MEDILLYFSLKYKGDFKKIYQAIVDKEEINQKELDKSKQRMECKYTTIVSDDYPQTLKHIEKPPFVIYYYGDLNLVNQKTLGVAGTTKPSQYGIDITCTFVKDLVENNRVLVNGLDLGIDEITTQQVIDSKGKNIVVLPCGIDCCYPEKHRELYEELKENHLMMSEYPFDLKHEKSNSFARNRLIAGLSEALLVTETEIESTNMITVGYTLDQGKYVMCIPSSISSQSGCNTLIKQGAMLVEDAGEVLNYLSDSCSMDLVM